MAITRELFDEHVWCCPSPVEVLLRGHLWIEHLFERLLAAQLRRPDELDFDRTPWRQKLALCAAHGAIPRDVVPAFAHLNKIRNQLAHDLGAQPADTEIQRLLDLSPEPYRRCVEAVRFDAGEEPGWGDVPTDSALATLRLWLFAAVMDLSYRHEVAEYDRQHHEGIARAIGIQYAKNRGSRKDNPMTDAEAEEEVGLPPRPVPGDFFRAPEKRRDRTWWSNPAEPGA